MTIIIFRGIMKIANANANANANATVLVTGANRGIGHAFAMAALARSAPKVYAGARDSESVTLPGVTPLRLDVNSPADIAAEVEAAGDVTVVINNAGIAQFGGLPAADAEAGLRFALPKSSPEHIVGRAFDALEAGAEEVLADELTQQVKLGLSVQPGVYLQARDRA